jgi:type I site-specific restriction-modification system R (restriction) subunit
MQAIARVNCVFRDKLGSLVVDYLGLAHELKAALATYTESGGTGRTALDQQEAVALLPAAQEHILRQENGKERCVKAVRYQNRAIEAVQVIEELIALAKEMRKANARGEELGLSEDELAFYDALEANDSAVKVLGDETLRGIARELVETVRKNVTIDWTMRENMRAQLRVFVKRILRKHGYPPDKQEKATQTVLEQAEALSSVWAAA